MLLVSYASLSAGSYVTSPALVQDNTREKKLWIWRKMSPLSDERGNPENVSSSVEPRKNPTRLMFTTSLVWFLNLCIKNLIGAYVLWEILNNLFHNKDFIPLFFYFNYFQWVNIKFRIRKSHRFAVFFDNLKFLWLKLIMLLKPNSFSTLHLVLAASVSMASKFQTLDTSFISLGLLSCLNSFVTYVRFFFYNMLK